MSINGQVRKIVAEDLNIGTETVNIQKADGTTVTANQINISTIPYGNKTPVLTLEQFKKAITSLSASGGVIEVCSPIVLDTDVEIPSNIWIDVKKDCQITIPAGTTLTINGGIIAGFYQIFNCYGTLTGDIKNDCVYTEWFGAIGNKTTDCTENVQKAINFAEQCSKIVVISPNILWNYDSIIHPDNVIIKDLSRYDYKNNVWTAQQKLFLKTDRPEAKNANEFNIIAPYHPAVIIDNVGDGTIEKRASIVFRQDGVSKWIVGKGVYDDNEYFRIATPMSNALTITEDFKFGFNSSNSIVDYDFYCRTEGTGIFRFRANSTHDLSMQFYSGTTMFNMFNFSTDGITIHNDITTIGKISKEGAVSGFRENIIKKTTTYYISKSDSFSTLTNEGASGGFVLYLPYAEEGLCFEFVVVSANTLRIMPKDTDNFRGMSTGSSIESNTVGSYIKIKCVTSGVWEIIAQNGTWS